MLSLYRTTSVLVGCLFAVTSCYEYDPDYMTPPQCKPCDAMACPMLTFCAGTVVKDHCGCCSRCSSDLFQPHAPIPAAMDKGNACEERKCPKFQVCMINIQGLPLCTCPSSYICHPRRGKRAKTKEEMEVCGTDNVTYDSRCHMRIANCKSGRRIKRAYKGPCKLENKTEVETGMSNEILYAESDPASVDPEVIPAVSSDRKRIKEAEAAERRRLKVIERANRRKLKRKRRKDRQRRKEKKNRKHKFDRRNRMKRRNNSQSVYSARYGYLLGKRTKWGSSQVRRNRLI